MNESVLGPTPRSLDRPLVGAVMCSAYLRGTQMTAGHNALHGSGPDQQHAFEDALANVGCPDRRIDRRCIKCRPSNRYVTPGYPARFLYAARAAGSL